MLHLDRKSIFQGLRHFRLISRKPGGDDVAQGLELVVVDVFPLVLGKTKQENGSIGADSENNSTGVTQKASQIKWLLTC
jgi:hypothetical protein